MQLQNLLSTNDRKQLRESGFLSLLIHILHEPTIATLDSNHLTIDQFIAEFYSPTRIEKRRQCSRLLRSVIECPLPVKEELETLEVLEGLRSISECLYGEYSEDSVTSIPSGLASLQELLYRGFYFREGFNTFERLGGAFGLLDILYLYLDIRFGEWGIVEKSPILEHLEQCDSLRRLTIQLIGRLIYHSTDVQRLFLHNPSLFNVLAENYRDEQNILTRNSIVDSFQQLLKYQGGPRVCHELGMVKLLTENAVECHLAGDRKEELISNLELLSVLTNNSQQCRLDFLSTSGSMDMLLDLANPHRKYSTFILNDHFTKLVDYSYFHFYNMQYCIRRILKILSTGPEVTIKQIPVPEVVRSSCRRVQHEVVFYYLAMFKLFYQRTEHWRHDRKYRYIRGIMILAWTIYTLWHTVEYHTCTGSTRTPLEFLFLSITMFPAWIICQSLWTDTALVEASTLSRKIFADIFSNLYDHQGALEEFRTRDGCALLIDMLKYFPNYADMDIFALRAITLFARMDIAIREGQVERQRLRELGACHVIEQLIQKSSSKWNNTDFERMLADLKR